MNIISKKEYLLLLRSQRFLSKTRFFLHLINNKPEERLFFSNQKKLAEFFGYFCDTNKGVERFMQEFYKITGLITDPIYSGKMFFGLVDQLKNNQKLENKKIIALHSGGLSGIEGFEKRYKIKIFN